MFVRSIASLSLVLLVIFLTPTLFSWREAQCWSPCRYSQSRNNSAGHSPSQELTQHLQNKLVSSFVTKCLCLHHEVYNYRVSHACKCFDRISIEKLYMHLVFTMNIDHLSLHPTSTPRKLIKLPYK